MKKGSIIAIAAAVAVCAAGVFGVWKYQQVKAEQKREAQIVEKREKLAASAGLYNPESIVLEDTTEYQAEKLAEILGASVRTTSDGSYAVLYLPEGMSIEDVYANAEYRDYLPEMSPDYYVNAQAVDANNHELYSMRPTYSVSDEGYSQQSYLDYLNLQDTWSTTRGSGITVAVIDTGIDTDHPEFAGRISERSYDASNDKVVRDYGLEVIEDENGHGTEVAGIIAAGMNDDCGITGIAPEVELIVIRCECNESGEFLRGSDLVFGLAYAIECDADVVNMSFGLGENIFAKYTQLAVDSDVVCVAAAGNASSPMPTYPAADDNVIGVGALDTETWSLADYSNYGYSLLLAPGTTYTTALDGGYTIATGTSMAAPIVAAAVALYKTTDPYVEFSEMCELLKASSIDLGVLGEDRQNGFGALDIHALVCEEKGTITYEMLTDELKPQTQIFVKGHTIQYMPEPERENVVLDGWYHDIECMDECEYYADVFSQDVTLYAAWINEDEGTAYIYTILDDDTVEITSYTGRRRYLTIPAELEGRPVTSIGEYAFANNTRLRSVTLPVSLKNIGWGAFADCSNLRSIEIPENVVTIRGEAFSGCVSMSLASIVKNGALAEIGDNAFAMNGITGFHIPLNLTSLGTAVFEGSTGMRSITVEDGNANFQIINSALYNAAGTELIYYPAGLTGVYTIADGTTSVAESAFAYSGLSEAVIPEGMITLGDNAFLNSNIRTVTFPETLEKIGDNVFAGSNKLSSVSFAEEGCLTEISRCAFKSCLMLKSITVPKEITVIGDSAFCISGLTSVTFAENSQLQIISDFAFSRTQLTAIEFPKSLQYIGNSVFAWCSALSSVTWKDGSECKEIGYWAFQYNTSLKAITFPDSLTTIGEQSFYASGLEDVTLGASFVTVGDGAFSACAGLQNIYVDEANANYTDIDGVLFSKDETVLMMYPAGREGSYTFPASTVRTAYYAFDSAAKLTGVTLNEGLVELGGYAFVKCTSLVTPVLPASLTTIGESAFENCVSMSGTMTIPKAVISVGRYAFAQDYNLTNIVFEPESEISRLGYGSFAYCGITDFTVPGNVSSMGQEVFAGCPNLLTVTFEADSRLEAIAAWTFTGADELRQISFEEGSALKLLEARSLEGLRKLERVTLEYCIQLTTIDNYAFLNCPALQEVSLPESIEYIGRYAFNGCAAMSRIEIPESLEFIGRYAFAGTNNMNVYFHASVLPVYLEENWDYGIAGYYTAVAEVVTSGDWQYALTSDGKISIVAYTGSEENIELTTIDGYEVISIGGGAFKGNTTLESITLPNTLQGIYNGAFKGTTALTSITIPASVTVIDNEAFMDSGIASVTFAEGSELAVLGRYAFANTANLESIAIPAGVGEIRAYAFQNSGVKSVTFAENSSLTEIGRYAFAKSGLESIVLPAGVTRVDYDAFRECASLTSVDMSKTENLQIFANAFYQSGLTSVTIPASVEYIGEFCFTACPDLTEITVDDENENYASKDGVLYNKSVTKLITFPAGKTGSYTIDASVMYLGFAAFENSKIEEIIFAEGSGLITLGYRAFCNCDGLTTITIPDGVVSLDNYAFAYCDNLTTVTISENSQLTGIYKGVFYNCTALKDITIPDGVIEISDYAFYGCSALEDMGLSETSALRGIYDYAYAYSGVKEFTMPAELQDIGNYAFVGAKLDTLACNEAVISIGDYAFADCGLANTTVLTFPATVEYLGYGALRGAPHLKELTLPFMGTYAEDEENASIFALYGISTNEWSCVELEKVTILGGYYLGHSAFHYCRSLEEVTLSPETISIGEYAFLGDYEITEIDLPDSVEIIYHSAFYDCRELAEIILPEGIKELYFGVFSGTKIETITIPKNLTKLYDGVFSGCSYLKEVIVDSENAYFESLDGILYTKGGEKLIFVPQVISGEIILKDSLTEIGYDAFRECSGITKITLPDGLLQIGACAFENCTGLTEIVIPANVKSLEQAAFRGCSGLQNVVFLGSDTKIGPYSFASCTKLKSITLPSNLTDLETDVFDGCIVLSEIDLPDSLTTINAGSFNDCTGLKSITIPADVSNIYGGAFAGCSGLEYFEVDENNTAYACVDGILYDAACTTLVAVPGSISGSVTIPDTVISLGNMVFKGCAALEAVVIPDSVETIGYDCFRNCSALASITIGKGVNYIDYAAFKGTAYYDNPENWENGVLYIGAYALEVASNCTDIDIKEGTKLVARSFSSYSNLKSIAFPASLEYINEDAFAYSYSLKSVKFSGDSITIDSMAFIENTSLRSIEFPGEVCHNGSAFIITCNNLMYADLGSTENDSQFPRMLMNCDSLEVVSVPFCSRERLVGYVIDGEIPEEIIISTTGNMNTEFLYGIPSDTKIYCYIDESIPWPAGWNQGCTTYYKDEWYLVTFYVNDFMVTMDPIVSGGVLQAPAASLVEEYLPDGATLMGWDINGDGIADELPATPVEHMDIHAVLNVPVNKITVTGDPDMEVTDTQTLVCEFGPYNYNGDDTVVWTSLDETIATVDEAGLVTALAEGSVTITATLVENENVSGSFDITVTPLVYGIRLTETSGSLNVGETMELVPRFVLPEEDTGETAWASTDETIATVDNGVITGIAPGETTIVITHGEYTAEYALTVEQPLESISIMAESNIVNVGEALDLSVAYTPENTTDDRAVTWITGDKTIATVKDGVVTGVAPGTVTITAVVGACTAEYEIEVKAPIQWIVLNTTQGTMRLDRTKQLEVIYEPSNTTDDKTVRWSTSNPEVASVTESGLVTALKAGTAVITGTVGEHTATYTVTVIGLRDEATGITVTNSDDTPMAEDVTLEVEQIDEETAESEYAGQLEQIESETDDGSGRLTITVVYDISLQQDGQTVQPETDVDVEIPGIEDVEEGSLSVYRVEEDGSITDMTAELLDGMLNFQTEHFSVYAVAARSREIYPRNIALSAETMTLCPGKESTLAVTITPEAATERKLIWKSSDESIAAVTQDGVVKAVSAGETVITAETVNGHKSSCTVTVGHTEETDAAVAPGCTETGLTEGQHCTVCGAVTVVQTIVPAAGHSWDEGQVTESAGCTADGVMLYTCTVCGSTKTEVITHEGHAPVTDAAVAPTCTESGLTEGSHCDVCGEVLVAQETVSATGHSEVADSAVVPTCTEAGLTAGSHCDTCGETLVAQTVIDALGHDFEETVIVPTCEEGGYTNHVCSVCGDNYATDETEAIGHAWDDGVITQGATKTSDGVKTHTCANCGGTRTETLHYYIGEVTVQPGCETEGVRTYTCANCESSYTDSVPAMGHVWDAGEITTAPTRESAGEMTYTCTACDTTRAEIIPRIDYDVNGDGNEDVADLVRLMRRILDSSTAVNENAIDPNGDKKTDILDVIHLIRILSEV